MEVNSHLHTLPTLAPEK